MRMDYLARTCCVKMERRKEGVRVAHDFLFSSAARVSSLTRPLAHPLIRGLISGFCPPSSLIRSLSPPRTRTSGGRSSRGEDETGDTRHNLQGTSASTRDDPRRRRTRGLPDQRWILVAFVAQLSSWIGHFNHLSSLYRRLESHVLPPIDE